MNSLNHLRKQGTNALIDKILEEMYAGLIIQVQPELLLELYQKRSVQNGLKIKEHVPEKSSDSEHKEPTLRMPFSGSDAMSGMLEPAMRWKRFNIRLLDLRRMLYASQQ